MGRSCDDARNALVSLMLRAVGGLLGTRVRTLALTRDDLLPVLIDVFLVLAEVADLDPALLVAGFFFVDEVAGVALGFSAANAAEAAPAGVFATSLFPGQSRHIKTAVNR